MNVSKNELKAAFKELIAEDADFRKEVRNEISPVGGFNPASKAFRTEAADQLKAIYKKRFGDDAYGGHKLMDAFNTILRYEFQLKNVSALKDEQVPEARELFEQYKQLFQ